MYVFAYAMQLLALLCALGGAAMALLQLWEGRDGLLRSIEKIHYIISGTILLASAILLHALYWQDFSLQYVASYTDRVLPLFYRLTAFWAGQPGSMLFWALSVALSGSIFALTGSYKRLSSGARLWYWVFFYAIMAFFALVLTAWSNPFLLLNPVPADGNGLNPLLQNPGMIFHPPLLFWGYGGFTVPACLALAQGLAGRGNDESWFRLTRPFIILSWVFLTAGIVLGAWWAYMELGWGGYWAWDPVENASLIPWLIATAALHTLIVEDRRGKLTRVNVLMMALTTISAFFATYLVRSGVVQSVHAFGDGGVGTPLSLFILAFTVVSVFIASTMPRESESLAGPESREGFLSMVAWVLPAMAVIILMATMWPVISKIWTETPSGLDATFYNRVCLPLGVLLMIMMAVCPWVGWKGGIRDKKKLYTVLGVFVACLVGVWAAGYRQPLALVATAASAAAIAGIILLLSDANVRRQSGIWGALGTHLGMALLAIGVAFSGPYTESKDMTLAKGKTDQVGQYSVTLMDIESGGRPGYEYLAATLRIKEGDKELGVLKPERRIYEKFGSMQFSEVDVIPSLGNELYASLLGLDEEMQVLVKVSIEPLVNWLWIGGTLMCLLPLAGLRRRVRNKDADADSQTA